MKEESSQYEYACEGGVIIGVKTINSLREMLEYLNIFKYLWEMKD